MLTHSLAEFLDSVVVCSDCGTLLVAADSPEQLKDIAVQGSGGPYRRPGEVLLDTREKGSARDRAKNDAIAGASSLFGGLLLAALSIGRSSGISILTAGMIIYGLSRLLRVGASRIRAGAMRSSKAKARKTKARKAKTRGVDGRIR